jgi:hypothetical protein
MRFSASIVLVVKLSQSSFRAYLQQLASTHYFVYFIAQGDNCTADIRAALSPAMTVVVK